MTDDELPDDAAEEMAWLGEQFIADSSPPLLDLLPLEIPLRPAAIAQLRKWQVYYPIFRRIAESTLRVILTQVKPFVRVESRRSPGSPWRELNLIERHSPRSSKPYLFVQISWSGVRPVRGRNSGSRSRFKKIALHRLVWLLTVGCVTMPARRDVAHKNHDSLDCSPGNLELLTYVENRTNGSTWQSGDF